MSEGLPTDDQLRRIERGVQRRIDLRRSAAHRVVGTVAGFALLGGGLALVVPFIGSSASSPAAAGGGSSAESGAATAASAAPQAVLCHETGAADSATTESSASSDASVSDIALACGATAVDFQASSGQMPTADDTPQSAATDQSSGIADQDADAGAPDAVVCRAVDGALHVFPADATPDTLCARNGMTLP